MPRWLRVLGPYVAVLVVVNVNWADVLAGLVGLKFELSAGSMSMVVAILGTSIAPYLFFWQSENRVETMRAEATGGAEAVPLRAFGRAMAHRRLVDTRVDVIVGMVLSVVIMFAIIVATAATLGAEGQTVESAADAAKALEPVAGSAAEELFAAGFIGSGLLAVPVLLAAGSAALAALLGKSWSLQAKPRRDPFFYTMIGIGTVGAILLSIFVDDAIGLLVFSAIVNGIVAAPFLVIVLILAHNTKIMGRFKIGAVAATLCWITVAVMGGTGVIGLIQATTGTG